MANGNSRKISNNSKITLWIFACIVFPGLFFMSKEVISNDRIRAQENQRIEDKHNEDYKTLQATMNKQYNEIIQRLTRIETKMEDIK